MIDALEALDLQFPELSEDQTEALDVARVKLEAED